MKIFISLVGLSLALGAVAHIERRQGSPSVTLPKLSKQKAASIEEIKTQLPRADTKRLRIKYGPYKIKGANSKEKLGNAVSMDPAGTAWSYLTDSDFPRNITLLSAAIYIAYEDGRIGNMNTSMYQHHLTYIDTTKRAPRMYHCRDRVATDGIPGTALIAGAVDNPAALYTTKDGKFNSGYYLPENTRLMQIGDIVNYNNETRSVYSVAEIEFVQGRPAGLYDASTQILSIGTCESGSTFKVPQGKKIYAMTSPEVTVASDGYLVVSKGHVHDGGESVRLLRNGKLLCESKAIYASSDPSDPHRSTLTGMTPCYGPMELKKGDTLQLEALYDLNKHPLREHLDGGMSEGMALMGGTWATASK